MNRNEAARRAGMARSTWERIEGGQPTVALANLVAAADAVGLDLVCQLYPGRGPALRDSGQLTIARNLVSQAHAGWTASLEEGAGDHGEAIDLVLRSPRQIVAIEIDRLVVDWQSQYRRASLKRDWLAQRHGQSVRLVMVVEDTRRNRAALAPYGSVIGRALPAGTRAVLDAIRTGSPLDGDGLCWIRVRRPRQASAPDLSG